MNYRVFNWCGHCILDLEDRGLFIITDDFKPILIPYDQWDKSENTTNIKVPCARCEFTVVGTPDQCRGEINRHMKDVHKL